jgi:peptidoglycan hydrolase-like protein with peptidoglycan-binding domain
MSSLIVSLLLFALTPVVAAAQGISESDGAAPLFGDALYCPKIAQDLQRYDCDTGVASPSCQRTVPDDQVSELQRFLMFYYPDNTTLAASGAFLNGTRNAVIQFQLDTGIITSSADGGRVGPLTRAKIAALCAGTSAQSAQTTNGTSGSSGATGATGVTSAVTSSGAPAVSTGALQCPANFFSSNILPGQTDSPTAGTTDVANLQAFLRSYFKGSPLYANLYEMSGFATYGPSTKAAVTAFQLAEGLITQQEADNGLGGYMRAATRTRINALCFPTQSTATPTDTTAPGLSIQSFTVVPSTVAAGGSAGFTWTSRASNACGILESIDGGAETARFTALGQNGYMSFNPKQTATYVLSCSNALGQTVRSTPLALTVAGSNNQSFTYTPHCFYRSTTNTTEVDLGSGTASNEACVSACRARLASESGTVSFCRYVGANGGEVMNTLTPQTSGDGSCKLADGSTIPNGAVKRVYMFPNGNPANGSMNHDLCISSSVSATCTNGTMLGIALGTTGDFKYARCYDDQASQDKLEYYLTNLYNSILHRQPDTAGFSYWISQIRAKAVTFDDIEANFRTSAANGTDTAAKPAAHLTTTSVTGPSPTLSGTATNVGSQFTLHLIFKSEIAAQRSSYLYKPDVAGGTWRVVVRDSLKSGLYDYSLYDGNVQLELGTLAISAGATQSTTQATSSTQGTSASSATETAVTELYRSYLHREPDTSGLTYWVTEINAGRFTIEKLRVQFQVTYLYETILGREPDAAGLSYWVTETMAGRKTLDDVRANFTWCMSIAYGQPNSCRQASAAIGLSNQLASVAAALQNLLAELAASR